MMYARKTQGFTLLETIIYLAIYAIIMSGAVVSIYAIFGTSARNQVKAIVQEEGSYMIGKIDWAVTGAGTIHVPILGGAGDTLSVAKYEAAPGGNPLVFTVTSDTMTLTRGTGSTATLNNSNVLVRCPAAGCFTHTAGSGDGINPESVAITIQVFATSSDGIAYAQNFSTAKYLRK